MAMASCLEGLEPKRVLEIFSDLCQIPHGSKNEKAISDYIYNFAKNLNLECYQDQANNLIIKKPASPGYENAPTVILQAHMDMVCEKNADVVHDFKKDPIHILRDGDRIHADGTTLGADDATGVAFAMCVLEDESIVHPNLEVILTTDEEAGMSGIQALDFSKIQGRVIINLDCSDEGIVVGCAGSAVVRFDLKEERETVNADEETVKLRVQGLKGGHSGLDITKERGNANVLLTRILASAEDRTGTKLVTITGGLQNNAICREAEAAVTIAKEKKAELQDLVQEWQKILKKEFKISDPDVKVVLDEAEKAETRFTAEGSAKIIDFMMSLDSGVIAMNMEVPGVAETSGNVGTIVTDNDTVTVRVCYRSGLNSKKEYTIEKSRRLARMAHAGFAVESSSSEWEYKSDSRLRLRSPTAEMSAVHSSNISRMRILSAQERRSSDLIPRTRASWLASSRKNGKCSSLS